MNPATVSECSTAKVPAITVRIAMTTSSTFFQGKGFFSSSIVDLSDISAAKVQLFLKPSKLFFNHIQKTPQVTL